MPISDPEKRREYHRNWMAARRAAFFAGKSCAQCGNTEKLELDHVDPVLKVSHRIWSWSAHRREEELAKCQVLCERCHAVKSEEYLVREALRVRGELHYRSKLNEQKVREIRARHASGETFTELAKEYGISRQALTRVVQRENWKWVD